MTNCVPIVLRGGGREQFTVRVEVEGPGTGEKYTLMLGEPGVYAPRLFGRHEDVDAELARLRAVAANVAREGRHLRGFLYAVRDEGAARHYSVSVGMRASSDPDSVNLILVERAANANELLPRHFSSEKEAEAHSAEIIDALAGGKFGWETSTIKQQTR